ncbi:MAG: PhnP protein [Methanosaeta sp. NSP1]|nr:MAG: PhnP protein [Methanosaeta sp. NSP1]
MKVTLLGTGDAIGTPKIGCKCPACMDALRGGRSRRMRFSVLIESDEEDGRVLVDSSPDLRWQLLKKDLSSVDGVIWTHAHYDHYAGFAISTSSPRSGMMWLPISPLRSRECSSPSFRSIIRHWRRWGCELTTARRWLS